MNLLHNQVSVTVNGIPAIAEITYYDNEADYMEYDLKDSKGYPKSGSARWLDNIADKKNLWDNIEDQIREYNPE